MIRRNKRKMKNYFLFLILVLPLIIFSCRKDTDITTTETEYETPTILVTGNLVGQIIDETGAVMPDVIVRVGDQETVSNELGLYRFEDIRMNLKGTYVTAHLEGYFLGSDMVYPQNSSTNFSRIELLAKEIAGTFENGNGGTVNVSDAKVTFEPNSLVNAQGEVVNGEVQVVAKWLNPTADNLGDIMPGALFGLNTERQEVMMTSMGMLAVELYDASGNELTMAADKEATLSFPVPQSLLSIAPSTIPLWHFDEENGLWIEEGSATLEGDTYVGTVSHFTFWNVDFPYGTETVDINGCVKFDNGDPVTFRSFTVSVDGAGTIIWGSTDDQGQFYGPVPLGETLIFEFVDECGNLQEFTVGPFTEDTTIEGCFTLDSGSSPTITGQLVDCDGEGVNEGVLLIQGFWPWDVVITDENGFFSYTLSNVCSSQDISYTAYDYDNTQASFQMSANISGDQDLGIINVCDILLEDLLTSDVDGQILEFFDLNLAVDTFNMSPDGVNYYDYSIISGYRVDDEGHASYITLMINNLDVGAYSGNSAGYSYAYNPSSQTSSFYLSCDVPCSTVTINITSNEGPGGFLEGDYSGMSDGFDAMQNPITDIPVSGTFRIRIPN